LSRQHNKALRRSTLASLYCSSPASNKISTVSHLVCCLHRCLFYQQQFHTYGTYIYIMKLLFQKRSSTKRLPPAGESFEGASLETFNNDTAYESTRIMRSMWCTSCGEQKIICDFPAMSTMRHEKNRQCRFCTRLSMRGLRLSSSSDMTDPSSAILRHHLSDSKTEAVAERIRRDSESSTSSSSSSSSSMYSESALTRSSFSKSSTNCEIV